MRQRVVPETAVARECFERIQEQRRLDGRIPLAKRCFQLFFEVAKPDRVPLILWVAPMSRLVQWEARRMGGRRMRTQRITRKRGHLLSLRRLGIQYGHIALLASSGFFSCKRHSMGIELAWPIPRATARRAAP